MMHNSLLNFRSVFFETPGIGNHNTFPSGIGYMEIARFTAIPVVCVWILIFVEITNVVQDLPMMHVASVPK
jgi:hypothetical protein